MNATKIKAFTRPTSLFPNFKIVLVFLGCLLSFELDELAFEENSSFDLRVLILFVFYFLYRLFKQMRPKGSP